LWPAANIDIECRWSGTFDTTSDGLPLIGPVPGAKGVYAAYGSVIANAMPRNSSLAKMLIA
jgi:glycine/D-amino acid oxidase-like deaminating enzyme